MLVQEKELIAASDKKTVDAAAFILLYNHGKL